MCTLDIILLCLTIPAIIRGIRKGLVDQTVALVALIVSGYLAYAFADKVGRWLGQYITVNPTILYVLGFAAVVIVCVLVFNLLAKLLSGLLDKIGLGWLNKLLGVLVGVFSTMIVIGLLFSLFADFNTRTLHLGTSWMDEFVILEWCRAVAGWVFPFLRELFSSFSLNVPSI